MRLLIYVVLFFLFQLSVLGIPAGAQENGSVKTLSPPSEPVKCQPTNSANALTGASNPIAKMTGQHGDTISFSNMDLMTAVENVLQERPDLILSALEKSPVALAELVEHATQVRQAKAEEGQWLAEMKHPKVPEIDQDRPMRGSPHAPITIVEYSDFECPYCRAVSPTIMEVFHQYEDSVRVVYKHNPLSFHATAEPAARFFEAISLQNQSEAWRFHDRVFEEQDNLAQGIDVLKNIAAELEIDQHQLEKDLNSDIVQQRLAADLEEAKQFGFDGTPAFLINGVSLIGNHPKKDFDKIIKLFISDHQKS